MGSARAPSEHSHKDEPPKDETLVPKEQPQKDNKSTKRQHKRNAQKASKLSKKSKNLRIEINDLKSQKDDIEDKIKKASSSTSARFKRKKIRSMKREATTINEKIQERTKELKTIEVNPMSQTIVRTSQTTKANKRLKKKIEDLNRKIRRVKGGNKAKNRLIAKREALKLQLNDTTPRIIEGAFGGNYSKYRIDGKEGMDRDFLLKN